MKSLVRQPPEHAAGDFVEFGGVLAIDRGDFSLHGFSLVAPLSLFGQQDSQPLGRGNIVPLQIFAQLPDPRRRIGHQPVELCFDFTVPPVHLGQFDVEAVHFAAGQNQVAIRQVDRRIVDPQAQLLERRLVLLDAAVDANIDPPATTPLRRNELAVGREDLFQPDDQPAGHQFVGRAFQREPGALVIPQHLAIVARGRQRQILHPPPFDQRAPLVPLKPLAQLLLLLGAKPLPSRDTLAIDGAHDEKHRLAARPAHLDKLDARGAFGSDQALVRLAVVERDALHRPVGGQRGRLGRAAASLSGARRRRGNQQRA